MSEEHVLHSTADGVCSITFNRPEKKNAFTLAMYESINGYLDRAARDPQVRCVVLAGTGGVFTGGNDLGDFMKNPPTSADTPVFRFLLTLLDYEKPIIAAVEGPAIGIGTTMLLHCDFAYAAEDARFQMPFVNLGLCPEGGSSLLFPRIAGERRAAELLMLGDPFSALVAKEVGLVNDVVETHEVHRRAHDTAAKLAKKAPAALRLTKRLLREPQRERLRKILHTEGEEFIKRLSSPEAAEAFQSFFQKREPDFSNFA